MYSLSIVPLQLLHTHEFLMRSPCYTFITCRRQWCRGSRQQSVRLVALPAKEPYKRALHLWTHFLLCSHAFLMCFPCYTSITCKCQRHEQRLSSTPRKSIRMRKLGEHLNLPQTSRANPAQWRSTHNNSGTCNGFRRRQLPRIVRPQQLYLYSQGSLRTSVPLRLLRIHMTS